MIVKPESIELFRMYLLGELPDGDRTRLEEVLFANEDYYEQLLVTEDELRYDYAEGLLGPERRARFEKRFAISPGDREMLEFASALVSALTTPVEPPTSAVEFACPAETPREIQQPRLGKWDRLPSINELVTRSTSALQPTGSPDSWRQRLQARDRLARVTRLIPRLKIEKVEQQEVIEPKVEEPKVELTKSEQTRTVQPVAEQSKVQETKRELPKLLQPQTEQPKVLQREADQPKVEPAKEAERRLELPIVVQPDLVQPKAERVKAEDSKIELPIIVHPEALQPKEEQAKVEEPKIELPVAALPEAMQPKIEQSGPALRPEAAQPEMVVQAEPEQPEALHTEAELPRVEQAKVEQARVEQTIVEPPNGWELPEWELPESQKPQEEQLELELPEPESLVANWRGISAWDRLARLGLALVALVLIVSVVVIVVQTIRYQSQVRDLRRELSLQNGFRAQTEEEKRKARELALDLEVERSRRLMLEEEASRHPKQASEKVDPPPPAASFILSAGLNRDSGPLKKPLIQTGDAERVRLQLNLKRAGDYQTYQANLRTADGKLVWGQAGLRPSRFGPIQVIAVTLLARLVPPGDYHVELKGLAPGGMAEAVDDYYFSVAAR